MRNRFRMAGSALALSAFLITGAAHAQDSIERSVTVSGEGTIEVAPDQATVRFGVVSKDQNPEAARAANASASAAAMDELRALGIEERFIQMEGLRLQPERRFNERSRTWEEVGFEAVREVKVLLDDLDQLPVVVARVVQLGANRLNGVTYGVSAREEAQHKALEVAALNARAKAELLASTLGAELGMVLRIQESGTYFPRPNVQLDEMVVSARGAVAPEPAAYASGQIEVRANVQVVFALRQP